MSKHQPQGSPSPNTPDTPQDKWDMDFAISVEAKELRQQGRTKDALNLLELRISGVLARELRHSDGSRTCIVPEAKKIDSIVLHQAASLHVNLSQEPEDRHHQRARKLLIKVLRNDRANYRSWQLLGDLYQREGRLHQAAQCYVETTKCDPNPIPAYGKLAGVVSLLGRLDIARKVATRMCRMDETNQVGFSILAQIELDAGNVDASREALHHLIQLDPSEPVTCGQKAQIELAAGDIDAARNVAERSIELDPTDPIGWGLKALVELAAGDIGAASDAAERRIELDPSNPIAWGLKSKIAIASGDAASALEAIEKLKEIDPTNSRAFLYEGRIAIQRNDLATAQRCGAQLMKEFHPSHLFYLRCLVVLGHFNSETYDMIVKTARKSGQIAPDDMGFSLTSDSVEDALAHLDRELFAFNDDVGHYSRSTIFTSTIVPIPIDGLSTDVASNGNRKLWGPVIRRQAQKLHRLPDESDS
jgi:tetratricopeptide (TPR) repeat protein